MSIGTEDYAFVADFLREQCALILEPGKEYLIDSRLTPVARRYGFGSLPELIQSLRAGNTRGLANDLVEAMVTNETSFFRDVHPFETLRRTVLPELIAARQSAKQLDIWFAACSTGQEPYTVALILKEYFPELAEWKVNLLGTDISRDALNRAQAGRYSQIEVNRGLPTALLLKYFTQHGSQWQLRDDVRAMVQFQPINLARPWPSLPPQDLVFLRNVMIYFDVETKKSILQRVTTVLRRDGYLILGGAETTYNLDNSYERVEHLRSGFYRFTTK